MNLIFIMYLEIVEELHLGFVMVYIVICCFMGLLKWYVYILEEICSVKIFYDKGEGFEWHDLSL